MTDDLTRLERLRAEAPEGPADIERRDGNGGEIDFVVYGPLGDFCTVSEMATPRARASAALIVAAVNALPGLIAEVRALRKVAAKAEEVRQLDLSYAALQEDHAEALAADPERGASGYEDDLGEMGAALDRSYLALFAALPAPAPKEPSHG